MNVRLLALYAAAVATGLLLFCYGIAAHAQVLPPSRGGTGTAAAPAFGQVPLGTSAGVYAPAATSSLGLAHAFSVTYPLRYLSDVLSLAWGTTTSNTFAGTQTFTNAPVFSSLSGLLKGNGSSALTVAVNGTDYTLITAKTCNGGDFVSAVTAGGVFTCGTPGSVVYPFPGNATTTTITFTNGLVSNASTTIGTLHLQLTNGAVITTGGTVSSQATSSPAIGSGLAYTGTPGAFLGGTSGTLSVSGLTTSNFSSANVSQWTNDAGYLTSAVSSLKQTYGSAQTGAITIGTSSAATSNGVTVGLGITNSAGTFTLTPTVSVAAIPNSALANSTISGVSLGGTLAALSATDSTLTFSGSYTGTTARTVGINLGNANTWTALQQFTGNASSSAVSSGFGQFGKTATTTLTTDGKLGVGSSTPAAQLSIGSIAGVSPFAIGSSSGSQFGVNDYGQVQLSASQPATTSPQIIDWPHSPQQVEILLGSSATTISFINATTSGMWGSTKRVVVCNPAQTAGALTWTGVEWIGTAPTQTTTANQCDFYFFDITHATSSAYKVAGQGATGFQ
jgi:hypothetical protein